MPNQVRKRAISKSLVDPDAAYVTPYIVKHCDEAMLVFICMKIKKLPTVYGEQHKRCCSFMP
jgi:hypothetical protein